MASDGAVPGGGGGEGAGGVGEGGGGGGLDEELASTAVPGLGLVAVGDEEAVPPPSSSSAALSDDDDLDLLSSRACALASVPVPDYADAIARKNRREKKKYGDRFSIDDEEDPHLESGLGEDASGMALAERTSQILSNFQDYVSGMGEGGGAGAVGEILEGGGGGGDDPSAPSASAVGAFPGTGGNGSSDLLDAKQASVGDLASGIRSDNKNRLLEKGGASGAPANLQRRSSLDGSVGSHSGSLAGSQTGATLQREWTPYDITPSNDGGNEASWEDDVIARGQRYTHPLLQSQRVKIGICNCLAVTAILIGVGAKINKNSRKAGEELGDKKIKAFEDGLTQEKNQATDVPYPSWTPPEDIYEDMTEEEQRAYHSAANKYHPKEYTREHNWTGTTYMEAFNFCSNRKDEDNLENMYAICPYDALCPLGHNRMPLGGYWENEKGKPQWAPLSGSNDWVQLSRENACIRFSHKTGAGPEWGIDGTQDPKVISRVFCCLSDEPHPDWTPPEDTFAEMTEEEQLAYQSAVYEYHPKQYTREHGWAGNTYLEAFDYCSNQKDNNAPDVDYGICPFEAVCPFGHDHMPLGGYWESEKGKPQWAPLSESNDWVQLSQENSCIRFSDETGGGPEWGIDGTQDPEVISKVLCCVSAETLDESDVYAENVEGVEASLGVSDDDPNYALYREKAGEYLPLEFDRSKGWTGQTYVQALQFCGAIPGYEVCPYAALCPKGSDHAPLGGVKSETKGSWIPLLDSANDWVQVGLENTCIKYSEEHQNPPAWSITGEGNEETTRHLVCCVLSGAQGPSMEEIAATGTASGPTGAEYLNDAGRYQPVAYGRHEGWTGGTYASAHGFCMGIEGYALCQYDAICPDGHDSVPLGGYMDGEGDQAWIPISDAINDWVNVYEINPCIKFSSLNPEPPDWGLSGEGDPSLTPVVMCCLASAQEGSIVALQDEFEKEEIYKETTMKYVPTSFDRDKGWIGQTFHEAEEFCAAASSGGMPRGLCPFQAVCPGGPRAKPLGGYRDEAGGASWVPILSEGGNNWVQVAPSNPCIQWSYEHPEGPLLGISGKDNEAITRHIICCVDVDGGSSVETAAEQIIEAVEEDAEQTETDVIGDIWAPVVKKYDPIVFRRDTGWLGQSYLEAVNFCGSHEGYEICPFDAICPEGHGGRPLMLGYDGTDHQDQWAPFSDVRFSDEANNWVSLDHDSSCISYLETYGERPEWGMEGNEEMTRVLYCCKGSMSSSGEESFMYQMAIQKYHPQEYSRKQGWLGQTYDDAVAFCRKKGDGTDLCNYNAICPMLEYDLPTGGPKDEPNGAWMPLSDVYNSWVSVGTEHTCKLYHSVFGEEAEWGLTGENNEELTRNVMCCEEEEVGTSAGEGSENVVEEEGSQIVSVASASATPKPKPTTVPTPSPTPLPTLLPTPLPTAQPTPLPSEKPTLPPISGAMGTAVESYKLAESYHPEWFDRSSGWTGQTFDEAFQFCSSKGLNHDLCPYEVICPAGPLSMPYGGIKDGSSGSWAPLNEPFNSWVQVGYRQTCVRYENLNPESTPEWGLTGLDNDDLTRHVLCCKMYEMTEVEIGDAGISQAQTYVTEKYGPKWFNRDDGWEGQTYTDALVFCASKDSSIPCPYEAYCPDGEGGPISGGYDGTEEAWAAIMDVPNGFVQIGSYEKETISQSCMKYNSLHDTPPLWGLMGGDGVEILTPHLMCCKEPLNHALDGMEAPQPTASKTKGEQHILSELHPVWYNESHGYKGTTHVEAAAFCNAVGNMVLCPMRAYCPDGIGGKLFLQRNPFEEEQWAPAASEFGTDKEYWVSISSEWPTCSTHEDLTLGEPKWTTDGSQPELKQNVLCCESPQYLSKEENLMNTLNPIWMDVSHGWKGGSHDDAILFCESFGNRKLCPYTAYCPHGPGQQVMMGHAMDFNTVGEQWSAVYGKPNQWVMIGQKYGNSATTCMDSSALEGVAPDWGLTNENADMKQYILCCSF